MGGQFLKLAQFVELESDSDADGAVLINGQSGVIYSCNATAATLVTEIAKGVKLDTLPALLAKHFDVSVDRALRDTRQFLDALQAAGLLEMTDRPVGPAE